MLGEPNTILVTNLEVLKYWVISKISPKKFSH